MDRRGLAMRLLTCAAAMAFAPVATAETPWSTPRDMGWNHYAASASQPTGALTASWQTFDANPTAYVATRLPGQDFGPAQPIDMKGSNLGFRLAVGGDGSRYFAVDPGSTLFLGVGRAGQAISDPQAVASTGDANYALVADPLGDAAVEWWDADGWPRVSWQPAGGNFGAPENPSVDGRIGLRMDAMGDVFVIGRSGRSGNGLQFQERMANGAWELPVAVPSPPAPSNGTYYEQVAISPDGQLFFAWVNFGADASDQSIWGVVYRNGSFRQLHEFAPPAGDHVSGPLLQAMIGSDGRAALLASQNISNADASYTWTAAWGAPAGGESWTSVTPPYDAAPTAQPYGSRLGVSGFDSLGNLVTVWTTKDGVEAAVRVGATDSYCAPQLIQPYLGGYYSGAHLELFPDGSGIEISQGQVIDYKALDQCGSTPPTKPAPATPLPAAPAAQLHVGRVARVSRSLRTLTLRVICAGRTACRAALDLTWTRKPRSAGFGGTHVVVRAGTSRRVRIMLGRATQQTLRRHMRTRAYAIVVSDAGGSPASGRLVLRRA
jgi:hypothetical protein